MAATYTEITLQEMETFLTRAFHALHPKKSKMRGEVVYDLHLSDTTGIRVWTSISGMDQDLQGGSAAGVGQDAIRVQLYSFTRNKPLMPGKAPIVKRTQGWRDSLRERIEDDMERYSDKEAVIESGGFVNWGS